MYIRQRSNRIICNPYFDKVQIDVVFDLSVSFLHLLEIEASRILARRLRGTAAVQHVPQATVWFEAIALAPCIFTDCMASNSVHALTDGKGMLEYLGVLRHYIQV